MAEDQESEPFCSAVLAPCSASPLHSRPHRSCSLLAVARRVRRFLPRLYGLHVIWIVIGPNEW